MDNLDKKVQLICLLQNNPQESVVDILSETTDIPSCVSYTVDIPSGKKMFHIPEKGREILLTGKGNKNDVCKSRLEKYLKGGYSFV